MNFKIVVLSSPPPPPPKLGVRLLADYAFLFFFVVVVVKNSYVSVPTCAPLLKNDTTCLFLVDFFKEKINYYC